MSARDLEVLSIYGELDGLVPEEEIRTWAYLLPADTEYLKIPGGNHAQFGRYGDGTQSGDNPATVSINEQERIVVQAVAGFLDSLGDGGR
jgi:pimeloyl-ACP methyl ester carboxylesterase